MDVLTTGEIQRLMQVRGKPCLSLYIPTHHATKEVRQDSIRLKNLLREAEPRLSAFLGASLEVQKFLEPAVALIGNSMFWEHQSKGLALFLSSREMRQFVLPLDFQEFVAVGDRFHLKPVFPLLSQRDRFFVLALNQKHLRLYEATRFTIRDVDLKNIPTNLDDALQYDRTARGRQFRAETGAGSAQRPGSFHGQGVGTDSNEHKKEILRFFQLVDKSLQEHLLADGKVPLVLAGPEFLLPIYKEASSYPLIVNGGLAIHADGLDLKELHKRAGDVVQPIFEQRKQMAINQFHQLMGTARTSESLPEIISAAHTGRVLALFTPLDVQRWGKFDAPSAAVEVHATMEPGDEDLLDLAALQTIQHDGAVYVLKSDDMPERKEAVAVFRY